jgi:phosphatidate phosphatase APP1
MTLIPGFIRRFFERKEKHLTVYPTYGYRKPGEDEWTIPLRVWVHKRRPVTLELIALRVRQRFEQDIERELEPAEKERLKDCLSEFVADDDSNEAVEISFNRERSGGSYRLSRRTNFNGLVEEEVRLPAAKAEELLKAQASGSKWLTLTARTEGFSGTGRVRLLDATGVSVISDIDDTIKVTKVPAGKKTVLRRTFLEPYEAVPKMRDRYAELHEGPGDVSFHYVSGSPWQIYRLLRQFLIEESRFPEGTFHMKSLRKNLFDRGSWQDIRNFVLAGETATLEQKIEQITELMINLPGRDFVLFGDSGEKDPEVYRALARLFPGRVKEIFIRDVLGQRLTRPAEDVKIQLIEADPVFLDTERLADRIKKEVLGRKGLNLPPEGGGS